MTYGHTSSASNSFRHSTATRARRPLCYRFGYVKHHRGWTKYRHLYDSSYPTIDLRPGTDIFAEWPRQGLVQAYLPRRDPVQQQIDKSLLTKLVNGTYTRKRTNAADPAARMEEVAAKRRALEEEMEKREAEEEEESDDEYALGGF